MSKPIPILRGEVRSGKVHFDSLSNLRSYLYTFSNGDRVEIVIRHEKSKRSLQQNAYYWGVVLSLISQETGDDAESLHDFFKTKFLKHTINVFGKEWMVIRSTSDLTTKQFVEYIERIKRFASKELSLVIPEADEVEI